MSKHIKTAAERTDESYSEVLDGPALSTENALRGEVSDLRAYIAKLESSDLAPLAAPTDGARDRQDSTGSIRPSAEPAGQLGSTSTATRFVGTKQEIKAMMDARGYKEDLKTAWIAGYYHAGYTNDSAYAVMKANEFAAEFNGATE